MTPQRGASLWKVRGRGESINRVPIVETPAYPVIASRSVV